MADFSGTGANEQITSTGISSTVAAVPWWSIPSSADDSINGGGGTDAIAGAGGNDTISFSGYGSTAHGEGGDDTVRFEVPLTGGSVLGAAYGDDGTDAVSFQVSHDSENIEYRGSIVLRGGGGNDTLEGSLGFAFGSIAKPAAGLDVSMYGDAGNDQLAASVQLTGSSYVPEEGGNNRDFLYGGSGDDTYKVQELQDVVIENAGEGYDTVVVNNSSTGSYTLSPNVEKVEVWDWYGHLPCDLTGNDQGNQIIGTASENTLTGMGGNDTIYGQDGDDTIYGGRSLDDPTDGPDRIYGDAGNDQVWAGGGDDIVYGGVGNEIHLSGQSGNDTLYGDAGTDYLAGGSGNDILYGGTENDRLSGTDGLDRLFGQGGTDTFDYDAVSHSRVGTTVRDVVGDFTGVGGSTRTEAIDLSTIDANTGVSGNQAFTFRGTSAFSAPGQVRVQASGTSDTLIQANVTGTSGAEMEILVTDGTALPTSWNALDFLL